MDISTVILVNIESFINQYMYYSDAISKTKFKQKELMLVKLLYKIASRNPTIGFEASNQYMFTQNQFLEKIICLKIK